MEFLRCDAEADGGSATRALFSRISTPTPALPITLRTLNFSIYAGLPWHYALMPGERPMPGTLAGKLRAGGWRTACISNGNLDWEDLHWLLKHSRAFELFADYTRSDVRR